MGLLGTTMKDLFVSLFALAFFVFVFVRIVRIVPDPFLGEKTRAKIREVCKAGGLEVESIGRGGVWDYLEAGMSSSVSVYRVRASEASGKRVECLVIFRRSGPSGGVIVDVRRRA